MPKQETVAALQSSDIVGHYECLLYTGDAKNDWHYVTITEEAPNVFLWSNKDNEVNNVMDGKESLEQQLSWFAWVWSEKKIALKCVKKGYYILCSSDVSDKLEIVHLFLGDKGGYWLKLFSDFSFIHRCCITQNMSQFFLNELFLI